MDGVCVPEYLFSGHLNWTCSKITSDFIPPPKKKKIKILLPTPNWGMNPKAFANKVREVLWLLL